MKRVKVELTQTFEIDAPTVADAIENALQELLETEGDDVIPKVHYVQEIKEVGEKDDA